MMKDVETNNSCLWFTCAILICMAQSSLGQEKNYIGIYGGLTTDKDLKTLTTQPSYNGLINSYLGVVFLGREIHTYEKLPLSWAIEAQVAKHWRYQQHWETNALVILRWHKFPWDHYLDTSFAIGDGISYASSKPKIEIDKMGKTSNVLDYMMLEWECKVPQHPSVSLFTRIHHRSGVFGLINNISGGSNMVTAGVRVWF